MDDTLYKEHAYRDSGYRTVARHFAACCGVSPHELYLLMNREPSQAFEHVEELAAERGVKISVADQLCVYRSHFPDITLDNDAADILSFFRQRDIPMGVITDGRAWGQMNKIEALRLDRFFDKGTVMATVLLGTDKHSAKPFEAMEEILRQKGATSFAYVGDNLAKDFVHPNLMGWDTIMLRDPEGVNIHPQNLADWPAGHHPHHIIDSLTQLKEMI